MVRLDLAKEVERWEKIEPEFKNYVQSFKPIFGNERHIHIRDAIASANELQHIADQIMETRRGGAKALHDAIEAKTLCIELMKQ